jgi:putative ABC transport system substrate-binding protein
MKRRQFLAGGGGALVGLSQAARAQQAAMPVVGFLNPTSSKLYDFNAAAFRQGLKDVGFIEGENVRIEYRWGEGDYSRLPALAAELADLKVAVIGATGDVASARARRRLPRRGFRSCSPSELIRSRSVSSPATIVLAAI